MSVNRRPRLSAMVDPLAVDLADEFVVGVPCDDDVDRVVECSGDFGDRAGEPAAAIVLATVGESALVEEHDDRFDACFLQPGNECVDGLDLVVEGESGDATSA